MRTWLFVLVAGCGAGGAGFDPPPGARQGVELSTLATGDTGSGVDTPSPPTGDTGAPPTTGCGPTVPVLTYQAPSVLVLDQPDRAGVLLVNAIGPGQVCSVTCDQPWATPWASETGSVSGTGSVELPAEIPWGEFLRMLVTVRAPGAGELPVTVCTTIIGDGVALSTEIRHP